MGVFVGGSPSDYQTEAFRDIDYLPTSDATGNHQALLAGRIAHYFDMRGPCFSVDTACSSSLHAVHQAVQSIRAGETEQAVVASCRLNLGPEQFVSLSTNRYITSADLQIESSWLTSIGYYRSTASRTRLTIEPSPALPGAKAADASLSSR